MNINHLDSVKLDVGTNANLAEIKFKFELILIATLWQSSPFLPSKSQQSLQRYVCPESPISIHFLNSKFGFNETELRA